MSGERRHAIVLAAGRGIRLGRGPKGALPWNGEVLATRAARSATEAGCTVTVGVRPEDAVSQNWLRARCPTARIVRVHDADLGLSASLRAAVLPVTLSPVDAVIVMLVDQPGVDAAVIRRLFDARRAGRIARATWNGVPGNPVVFGVDHLLSAAAFSRGDAGARDWIRTNTHLVDDIECGMLARGDDIDVPQDLRTWLDAARSAPGPPL
ncbi:NTP transferase domain-containing protein [Microbacterium sp. EST19A]|uniref:nucleotidyltransferase family protein n=1 Tax=Microbacterium sp. EST19A TaxID=2862681 RepID=UPI001CBF07FA|nr:NTP transferase domain-containing protein [Microbacterium sp. EST19A]